MVQIIRKARLPLASDLRASPGVASTQANSIKLREARPEGFPLLFSADMQLIEPAVEFLHEHFVQRGHTLDTLRTYTEILYDWFETLEQNHINWAKADAVDLVAYRNRMMKENSAHTGRPYRISTINHRVRGILRFYDWAVRSNWLPSSEIAGDSTSFSISRRGRHTPTGGGQTAVRSMFVLRQYEALPQPLTSEQARELLSRLSPPYDLMARWQIYTGLRVSELLRLSSKAVTPDIVVDASHRTIDVMRKGRKPGYVIAPASLIDETMSYSSLERTAWLRRAERKGRVTGHDELFINARGAPVGKSAYQRVVSQAGESGGFKCTTHLLRATFACMMLARLERLASAGAAINPLLIVKVLMGHERIETTDRYLRAIAVESHVLKDVLETLLSGVE